MRTARRFVKDESGMTMGLAIIMILLLGVMGAGLLTFVSRDLNTVVEENRGQKAFEVADAGIGAAKRQLSADCSDDPTVCTAHYDNPDSGGDNIQWAETNSGLTLEDLDGDGDLTDWVNVTIESEAADSYKVISTGHYGTAQRKIEAVFKGVEVTTGSGDGLGHPLYYTPSDIKISSYRNGVRDPIRLNKISLFSEQDIIFEDISYGSLPSSNRTVFRNDMAHGSGSDPGATEISGDIDELCDWDSDTPLPLIPDPQNNPGVSCYENRTGPWNDLGRDELGSPNGYSHLTTGEPMTESGFAAEGLICGYPTTSFVTATGCDPARGSAADGVYGYDCTTGTYESVSEEGPCPDTASPPRGNQLTFVDKNEELGPGGSEEANPAGTLSYPFPRPKPIVKELYKLARESTLCNGTPSIPNKVGCSYTGVPNQSVWQNFFPNTAGTYNKIVFIDAQSSNTPVQFNPSSNPSNLFKGIIVTWCGKFEQGSSFDGVVLNLKGPDFTYQANPPNGPTITVPGCEDDPDKGVYRNLGAILQSNGQYRGLQCKCWVYANGGDSPEVPTDTVGVEFEAGSQLWYPTNRSWSFLNEAFETESPPTTFELQGWRELYE